MGWVKGSDRNFEASQTERYILSKPSFWIADDLTDSIPRQLRRFYDLVPAVNTNTALV